MLDSKWSCVRTELFELKGIARGVLSEVDFVKNELASIREEIARDRTWPRTVTVSVLGHVLLDEGAPMGFRREESGFILESPPVVTTLIGAKTVTLEPGERRKVDFPIQQNIRREALVWVTGPGLIESVFYDNWSCQACSGIGNVFIVHRMMQVGQTLDCSVVGVQR